MLQLLKKFRPRKKRWLLLGAVAAVGVVLAANQSPDNYADEVDDYCRGWGNDPEARLDRVRANRVVASRYRDVPVTPLVTGGATPEDVEPAA